MKKKFFPIYLVIAVLIALVGGQALFNSLDISAGPSKEKRKLYGHYEAAFKKLEVESTDKKMYKLSQVKAPVVILNFWASWCTPCLEEFPSIVKMKSKFQDDKVMVIGINSDEENQLENIEKKAKEFKFNFPNVAKSSQEILKNFMISAIPVSIIFHKGKVVEVSNGAKDFFSEEALETFEKLIKE